MPILNGNENATRMYLLKGRSARSRSIGTKLTPEEEANDPCGPRGPEPDRDTRAFEPVGDRQILRHY